MDFMKPIFISAKAYATIIELKGEKEKAFGRRFTFSEIVEGLLEEYFKKELEHNVQ